LYIAFAKLRDIVSILGLKIQLARFAPILWDDTLIFYLLTRIFSAVLGALTVLPVYLTGKKLFNERVALVAALTFAIMPFHIWHSHYSLPDVPMVFFMSWGVYFAAKLLTDSDLSTYLLSGFFIGLSASTKYNGGLAAVTVPLAHFLRVSRQHHITAKTPVVTFGGIAKLLASGVAAIFGFFVGTPYAFFDAKTFLRTDGPQGALWQFTNVGSTTFIEHLKSLWNCLTVILPDDLGYTFLVLFLVAFGYLIVRLVLRKFQEAEAKLAFLVIPGLFLVYYISGFAKPRSHYFMVAYPFIALSAAVIVCRVLDLLNTKRRVFSEVLVFLLLVAVFLPPFLFSVQRDMQFYYPDTRNELYTWAKMTIPKTAVVFYDSTNFDMLSTKLTVPMYKLSPKINYYPRGYLFTSGSLSKPLVHFSKLILVFTADAINRMGPNVKVYYYIL
jgi:4-amino-4-deoxy-L-arabinose transferase-like glycosyltransferase